GFVLSSLDRLDDAERFLRKAAATSPDDPKIHYQLGIVMDRLGRSVDAVDSYRRADKLHARS
ncbi:tetratricopeptide repeat protein, partial [bacterium]|nr:tetratricopeptide repeat protein [bacterium]